MKTKEKKILNEALGLSIMLFIILEDALFTNERTEKRMHFSFFLFIFITFHWIYFTFLKLILFYFGRSFHITICKLI